MTEEVENSPIHQEAEAGPKKKKKKKKQEHDVVDADEAPKKKKKKKKKPVDGEEKPKSLKKKKKKHAKSEEAGSNDAEATSSTPDIADATAPNVTDQNTPAFPGDSGAESHEAQVHPRKKKKKKKKKVAEGAQHDEDDATAQTAEDQHSQKGKKKKKKKTSPANSPVSQKKKSFKKNKKVDHVAESVVDGGPTGKLPMHDFKEKAAETTMSTVEKNSVPQSLSVKPKNNVFEIQPSNFILESEKALAARPAKKPRKRTTSNDSEPVETAAVSPTYEAPSPNLPYNYSFGHGLRSGLRCGLPPGLPAGM